MANGWTPERTQRQSELIKSWKPWEQSAGPKIQWGEVYSGKQRMARWSLRTAKGVVQDGERGNQAVAGSFGLNVIHKAKRKPKLPLLCLIRIRLAWLCGDEQLHPLNPDPPASRRRFLAQELNSQKKRGWQFQTHCLMIRM